jgi:hypothetical protein
LQLAAFSSKYLFLNGLLKWPHNLSAVPNYTLRVERSPTMLHPHAIDHSDDVEHLLPNRCIGLIRKLIQLGSEPLGGRPVGSVLKIRQPIEIDGPTHLDATAKAMVTCQFLARRLVKIVACIIDQAMGPFEGGRSIATVTCTVVLSITFHGLSANALAKTYGTRVQNREGKI